MRNCVLYFSLDTGVTRQIARLFVSATTKIVGSTHVVNCSLMLHCSSAAHLTFIRSRIAILAKFLNFERRKVGHTLWMPTVSFIAKLGQPQVLQRVH